MKFRVAHKGLILIGVPLIFELALFGGMLVLQNQAEFVAQRALRSKQVLEAINLATTDFVQFYNMVDGLGIEAAGIQSGPYKKQFALIRSDIDRIATLVKDNPQELQWVQELQVSSDKCQRMVNAIFDAYDRGEYLRAVVLARKDRTFMKKTLKESTQWRLTGIAVERQAVQAAELERQSELRQHARYVLYAALLLSVLMSIFLVLFFGREITGRLAVIGDNNRRLAGGKQLNPPVSGTDEITDLDRDFHRMANDLNEAREREREAQRLRDQVVSMVTHDLRSPLQTVTAFLEILSDESLTEKLQKLRGLAENSAYRMAQLINDLLDLDKLDSGLMLLNPSLFMMSEALDQAEATVAAIMNASQISITRSGDCEVFADQHRIIQILTNLLNNAIKYSPSGEAVSVVIADKDGAVTVSVSDKGRGIPAEMKSKIFDAFRQVEVSDASRYGGSGLGLAICKALVGLHGGTISVDSEPGKGSTFWFTIPQKGNAEAAPA